MPVNPRVFSPTQYIRIFIIVNLTTYLTVSAILRQRHPLSNTLDKMGPKKENTKKVAGNAKKAEAAASKQAAADARTEAAESSEWGKGAKDTSKKQAAAEKAAAAAAKKAEREALLAEEEKNQRATAKGANKKTAEKKSRGTLDLGQLDDDGDEPKNKAINATGIDNALDALSLTTGSANDLKLDRHPERRFKAAYKAYEERRLPEIEVEHPGLRKNQRIDIIRKEFERSEENPFNQTGNVKFDASKEELAETRRKVKDGVEKRLGEK
jgi:hypothetical protein